ncbi:M42 family metallopeptidase [Hazenella sp. IB182357]|uniref:M42 family metallopeptidase n=1 Tax=Polycladospora coralii TaxID=2771432 RepID=A0A926RTS3_9BACL|nr:M42 family metallopeptidase [Polycladospora coralii]MBD1371519.1 M42 family metallopeptidase [Polycladospora coralii]
MTDWKMFEELTQAPGAPGYEHHVRELMRHYLTPYADEVIQDRLGGLFAVRKGNDVKGPKVLVAGHMDEVSFMVTKITAEGFIQFQTLGGWWSQVMLAQRVDILTRSGKMIAGVIGSIPPHLLSMERRKKAFEIDQMFIDVGANGKEQVEEWGIQPGDFIIPHSPFTELEGGHRLMSKAWDNRFGCGLAIELLKRLPQAEQPNLLYSGATVQEEVGTRGAAVSSNLIQPDVAFAVDSGPAGDIPGVSNGYGEIGKGVLIRLYDRSMITLPGMRDFLLDIAESEGIPYQFFVSPGGTDAGRFHISGEGVPTAAIGICARYIHSHASIVDKEDIEASIAFIVALTKHLNQSTYESLLAR